ncbi:MAG TPA: hypothetical protein VNR87_05720, partial [Flavisolibacter sp.]|nr:hypothetical protein [Flavisolibacter sp.]
CSPKLEDISTTKEVISQGQWSVSYYFNGQDHTADFHGYRFDFASSGTLTASNDSANYSGSWSIVKDDNFKDIMLINFGTTSKLTYLNSEWHVTTVGLNNVAMKDTTNVQLLLQKL